MSKLRSYPKILALGHKHLQGLFDEDDMENRKVVMQEKVDGSQISFGVVDGELVIRSKGKHWTGHETGMFEQAFVTIHDLNQKGLLQDGWTYRGEYLQKKKHNVLEYGRIPEGHIILFDVDMGFCDYIIRPESLHEMAVRLGLEAVPTRYLLERPPMDDLKEWVQGESILGNAMEGVVIKNYAKLGSDGKTLMGKYVRGEFKEKHKTKKYGPGKKDILYQLGDMYRTEARWQKAVQHLKDRGELQEAPQDIGPLMKEVNIDLLEEEEDAIKDFLFQKYWKDLSRIVTGGLPEWYKEKLAEEAFDGTDEE